MAALLFKLFPLGLVVGARRLNNVESPLRIFQGTHTSNDTSGGMGVPKVLTKDFKEQGIVALLGVMEVVVGRNRIELIAKRIVAGGNRFSRIFPYLQPPIERIEPRSSLDQRQRELAWLAQIACI